MSKSRKVNNIVMHIGHIKGTMMSGALNMKGNIDCQTPIEIDSSVASAMPALVSAIRVYKFCTEVWSPNSDLIEDQPDVLPPGPFAHPDGTPKAVRADFFVLQLQGSI